MLFGKKKRKKNKKSKERAEASESSILPLETMYWIYGILMFAVTAIVILSYFGKAGPAGTAFIGALAFLFGAAIFVIPFVLIFSGLILFITSYKKLFWPITIAIALLMTGVSGILGGLNQGERLGGPPLWGEDRLLGGWIGFLLSQPLSKLFEFWVTEIIFFAAAVVGLVIFVHLFFASHLFEKEETDEEGELISEAERPLVARILRRVAGSPKFRVKEIEPEINDLIKDEKTLSLTPTEAKIKQETEKHRAIYQLPPFDLLEEEKESPMSGDIKVNSAIIKRTLQNFDIPVEMSEVNIGPTVTQYTLKPAEGVKLSKILGLSNDLSLALAAHPIRIEAPIPGRSLVGVEIPNKVRARVRLRNLIDTPAFQEPKFSKLKVIMGRDVSGAPFYADLAKMPHMLVAGATGTGKTILLNCLMTGFLYQNSPETLRMIMIDPKRVEFTMYEGLPHLLCPVIYDVHKTINALKWTISEMERRFGILSALKSRNIVSYNEAMERRGADKLPYIVIVIDELADLMAAKGKEMEAGIVRLAQMARAVGIHLVLATQRPSVEVITGLIKANITSRITFQVASQVDSRTVIDVGGAEKLLGSGDMLFISAEIIKPKRAQGAYISEKEVKKVVAFVKDHAPQVDGQMIDFTHDNIAQSLEKTLEIPETELEFLGENDPLYEEAKRLVVESRRASASLLQRRLRLGYARAARLIDLLEQNGIVGPADGARPREVFAVSGASAADSADSFIDAAAVGKEEAVEEIVGEEENKQLF